MWCSPLASITSSVGRTNSFGAGISDAWALRMGLGGEVAWEVASGGKGREEFASLLATPDGGCILAGFTESFGAGLEDGWIVKLSAAGLVEWQKTYGGVDLDSFTSLAPSPDGYYVGGSTVVVATARDAWVLEIDFSGGVLWQETSGGKGDDRLRSLAATPDGVAFTADSNSSLSGASVPFFRPWLVKLDGNGVPAWQKTYNLSGGDTWNHLVALDGGGFEATGEILAAAFFRGDVWVVKLEDDGDVIWDARFGDNFANLGADTGRRVRPMRNGDFMVGGTIETAGANPWLLRLDSSGVLLWDRMYGGLSFDNGTSLNGLPRAAFCSLDSHTPLVRGRRTSFCSAFQPRASWDPVAT
jgi:hypothetical protein